MAAGDARMAARGAAGLRDGRAERAAAGVRRAPALRALLSAQVRGDRKAEAVILGVLAQLHAMQGDFDRRREVSERQRQMLDELGPSVTARATSIERARVESWPATSRRPSASCAPTTRRSRRIDERYFRSTVAATARPRARRAGARRGGGRLRALSRRS